MIVSEITSLIEEYAPLALQEDYDNAGLLVGDKSMHVKGILITLDVTEAIVDEAIQQKCNLIVAHHPLIFRGLKNITGQNYIQRIIIKAIKNDIAVYAAHTNIDNVKQGVNGKIADKIGLINRRILQPKPAALAKLVTFVPDEHAETVRQALFAIGAGHIGEYDNCSFNTTGKGTFRGNENTNPFVGHKHKLHVEPETRIEVILPKYLINQSIKTLLHAHPYEEPAYDILLLDNVWDNVGAGIIGELEQETDAMELLQRLKTIFTLSALRHSKLTGKPIKKIALCGGAGSSLLRDAMAQNADAFISADFKYHEFFDAEDKIMIADIGHYESEQFTKELFYEIIIKKIPNFAVRISEVNTNPINFL